MAAAPPIVRVCLGRWKELNPDHELNVLDRDDVVELVGERVDVSRVPIQALSDIVRVELLARHGGWWTDATVLPVEPLGRRLQRWSEDGFFAFRSPAEDRPLSSWLLAATPEHPLVQRWRREVRRYWRTDRTLAVDPRAGDPIPTDPSWEVAEFGGASGSTYPYFWCHYLFRLIVETDIDARAHWERCPSVSSAPCDALRHLLRRPAPPDEGQVALAIEGTPVQKLDWRLDVPSDVVQLLRSRRPPPDEVRDLRP